MPNKTNTVDEIVMWQLWILQIVAVILCNTGIALLAYMDGITGSPTLGGVVLATSAAAGSAVYKVKVNTKRSMTLGNMSYI